MAVDPDVLAITDALDARLTALENAPAVDTTALTVRMDAADADRTALQGQIDHIHQAQHDQAQLEADAAAVLNAMQDPAKRAAIMAAVS